MSRLRKVIEGILDDRPTAKDGTRVSAGLGSGYPEFRENVIKRSPKTSFWGKKQTGISRGLARDLWIQSKSDAMQKRRT